MKNPVPYQFKGKTHGIQNEHTHTNTADDNFQSFHLEQQFLRATKQK